MKHAIVCGAGGFIGTHLVKRLKAEGYSVRGWEDTFTAAGRTREEARKWLADRLRVWRKGRAN